MKKEIEALARAYQEVTEKMSSKEKMKRGLYNSTSFVIPEDIPANERTAFHGAAAAASKAGKTHFTFNGKKHPVTMKKDVANAIADDVETKEGYDMDMPKDKVVLKAKKKAKGEDDPQPENGETAVMNPKKESNKSTAENVKTADRKPEVYVAPDGKKRTRMVPVDREVVTQESADMSIREKLLSVLENRGEHYKGATKPEEYDEKSKSSKGAMDMLNTPKEVGADIKKATDDNAKAEKKFKVSPKNSTDKSAPGDTKIINPPEDVTKKGGMKESFTKTVKSIANSYQSMYTPKEEDLNEASNDDMAAEHEMHWADHTKKAKEARDAGDREHAIAHQQAADAHSVAGNSYEKGSRFAQQNRKKAMAASKKANNFYDND